MVIDINKRIAFTEIHDVFIGDSYRIIHAATISLRGKVKSNDRVDRSIIRNLYRVEQAIMDGTKIQFITGSDYYR